MPTWHSKFSVTPGRRATTVIAAVLAIVGCLFIAGPSQAAAAPENLFGLTVPAVRADSDPDGVELGVQFKAAVAGKVTGVRFYKGAGNSGTHTGSLWQGSTRKATGMFTTETAAGWQTLTFSSPVTIQAGAVYTASYLTPNGHYAVTDPYSFPKITGNLTAIKGVYKYGGGYPAAVYQKSNYWVDVTFVATATAPPTTVPSTTITSTTSVAPTTSSPTSTVVPTTTTPKPPTTTTPKPPTTTTPPSNLAKPGPSNTGVPVGTVLTPYTGPHTITTAGTVIDSKDITGSLSIQAKNVTIRNSKIHDDLSATAGINVEDNGSATITDSEIYNFQVGIVYSNWTAIRINMHDITFDGMKMSSNARLQDSWIHGPKPSSDSHWDGVQVQNGVVNTVITGNFIDASGPGTNSALFLCPDIGPSTNGPLTVTGNWLDGGNYTVFILDGANGKYFISNISVTNNRFGHAAQYGPTDINVPVTWTGNVWDDTGAPLAG
jgi:hypothetical protein